jgi:hypothetical protein
MHRSAKSTLVAITLFVSPCLIAQDGGQGFFYVEETAARLPRDATLPGTSSTDVDLVDVDGNGTLDLFVAEGTESADQRRARRLSREGWS